MSKESELCKQLKEQLSDMFQPDRGDLDFGIYRIMNRKLDGITQMNKGGKAIKRRPTRTLMALISRCGNAPAFIIQYLLGILEKTTLYSMQN